jgi:alkylhydroperoxidase family enzyme
MPMQALCETIEQGTGIKMSRISPQSREGASPEVVEAYAKIFGDRDPAVQPGTSTGTPGDWWTTWGRVPGILDVFGHYGGSTVDPKLKSIAIIRTGYGCQSQFVFSQHCKLGRMVGLAEDKIAAIPYWGVSDAFDANERAILAYVDATIFENGRVHDRVFDALRSFLDEEQILMLTYAINMYRLHATTTRALKMEYDNVPDRIVEIPSPDTPGVVQDWQSWQWAKSKD